MDYLTVKEAAELRNCSERYIRAQIQNNKIKAETTTNASNGHEKNYFGKLQTFQGV